jgi:hypothetical protein
MRFNNRFFFALLTIFVTFFSSKSGVYGLPLPRPAPKVEISVPKPVQKRAEPDDREDQMLALRSFMEDVQSLGGSPYGRALMRRTMPVATADKVAMPTQLKASSSGFIFLPVVGAGQGQASNPPSDGQEKVGAAPVRQTMFINIEAPSGGQMAQIDIPGVKADAKKDDPCPDDKDKVAGAGAGTANQGQDPSKQGSKPQAQDQSQAASQNGNGAGSTGSDALPQDGFAADASQSAAGNDQNQGSQQGQDKGADQVQSKPDDSKTTPPASAPATSAPSGSAAVGTGTSTPSVTPKAKTELQAPPGIDESKKTKVVFKPLVDPEATTTPPPAVDNKATVPAVPATTPPPAPTSDLSKTGAAPDNADDKKPDTKDGPATAATSTQQAGPPQLDVDANGTANSNANANLSAAANPAALPPPAKDAGAAQSTPDPTPDPATLPPASLANANATTAAPAPSASTGANAAAAGNKDYFIYPVEQDDKLVDLKKGDMVAYVDKSGNISKDGSGDAVRQMLAGGGDNAPPPATQQVQAPPASTNPPPLTKRTHPRMFDLERRAIPEKQAIPKKKRAESNEKNTGFKLRPGISGSSIAYYGQPAVRRRSIRL